MPHCPNCSYKLVFLENRLRYKCAKCSRVFLQKFVENRDFRLQNKVQREIDRSNLEFEIKQKKRPKLTQEERRSRFRESAKKWRLNNLEKCKEYYRCNREKILAKNREGYWKNHERELERRCVYRECNKEKTDKSIKLWKERNKERYQQWLKTYLKKNIERERLKKRLCYWRLKQAKLAQGVMGIGL